MSLSILKIGSAELFFFLIDSSSAVETALIADCAKEIEPGRCGDSAFSFFLRPPRRVCLFDFDVDCPCGGLARSRAAEVKDIGRFDNVCPDCLDCWETKDPSEDEHDSSLPDDTEEDWPDGSATVAVALGGLAVDCSADSLL